MASVANQVLVLTCEFERLLVNADLAVPRCDPVEVATPKHSVGSLTHPEKLWRAPPTPTPREHSGDDIAKLMGVERWSALSTNVMTATIKERVCRTLVGAMGPTRGAGAAQVSSRRGSVSSNRRPIGDLSDSGYYGQSPKELTGK